MRKLDFWRGVLAIDIVKNAQFRTREQSGMQGPTDKGLCLVSKAQAEERPGRECGVTQPAETIVPIEPTAHLFGKRGRGSGDNGPGGSEGHQLEHQGTANHVVAIRTVILRP